jgi:hypothetical protein
MDEQEMIVAAGYGLAAVTVQMALLNSLAGKGGVPAPIIDELISKARLAVADSPEFSDPVIAAALHAVDRIGTEWKNMERQRH